MTVSTEDALFHVEICPSASCDVLILVGAIDLDAARRLYDVTLQALAGGREVALDWSQATHVGAGALQILVALGTALRARGQALSIAGDNPGVRRMLELTGLSRHLPAGGPPP